MSNAAVTVDLNARIAQFETEMKKATSSLDKFGKKGDSTANLLRTAFKSIGGAYIAKELVQFAKAGIDAADSLNDMSVRLGVTVKDLASLQLVAEQSGTSLEGIGVGLAKLNKSSSEAAGGNDKLAAALLSLGVTASTPLERFYQLADAVKGMDDPTKRAADLSAVLGKNYLDLIPTLSQGGVALRESAKASESFADAMARLAPDADKFNDQLAALKLNLAGVAANGLVPLAASLAELINQLIVGTEKAGGFGKAIYALGTINPLKDTAGNLKSIRVELAALEKNKAAVAGKEDNYTKALDSAIAKLKIQKAYLLDIQAKEALKHGAGYENYKVPQRPISGGDTGAQLECVASGGTWNGKSCTPKKKSGGTKSDPQGAFVDKLRQEAATLGLGSDALLRYEAAKLKLTGTNAKLAAGYIDQITAFKQQKEADDIQVDVAAHLKATNDEIYAQQQAWVEAGAALTDSMRTPLENANIEFARLQELLDRGAISWETYSRAVMKTSEALDEPVKKLEEMDEFAKNAAESIQKSMADFLFDPFADGLDGMLQGFGKMLQRMIADAVAADLARWMFGDLVKGGSGDGVVGSLLDGFGDIFSGFGGVSGSAFSGSAWPSVWEFDGGGFTGPGSRTGGMDGKGGFMAMLHPNETVIDHTKGQRAGGTTIVVNVNGSNNAPDVRRAAAQGAREALGMFEGARRYA